MVLKDDWFQNARLSLWRWKIWNVTLRIFLKFFFRNVFWSLEFEVLKLESWNWSFEFEVWSIVFFVCHVTIDEYDVITLYKIYIHIKVCIYIKPWSIGPCGGQHPPGGTPGQIFQKFSTFAFPIQWAWSQTPKPRSFP